MARILTNYWNFLTRHQNEFVWQDRSIFSADPHLLPKTLLWTCVFSSIYLTARWLSHYLYPAWFDSLPRKKKGELPSYALGLSHHFVVVPISMYLIYSDFMLPIEKVNEFDFFAAYAPLIPFTFGYFIADTILYTIPEVLEGRYAYFIHHTFAVLLLGSIASAGAPCVRAVPHFLLMELSTIFFGSAWILRQIGYRGHPIVAVFEKCFVFFYFILRVVHMPFLLYSISDHVHTLGPFRHCLVGVFLLQIYWFYQIIRTLQVRDMGGGSKSKTQESHSLKKKE